MALANWKSTGPRSDLSGLAPSVYTLACSIPMLVARFPPSEVAANWCLARHWTSRWDRKGVVQQGSWCANIRGYRTTRHRCCAVWAIDGNRVGGVFLIIWFANARSLLVDRSLEATTSGDVALNFCPRSLGWARALTYARRGSNPDDNVARLEGRAASICRLITTGGDGVTRAASTLLPDGLSAAATLDSTEIA